MTDRDRFPYQAAVSGVLELQPYQPGKPIEELERELGIANAIKLASNENPLGASPLALAAMHEEQDAIGRYPDANGFALKRALADHLGVSPTQLTLGNGSNDVLDMLARVFAQAGDEIVFSRYAFLVYPLVTCAVGARAVVTPARDWGHDLPAMAAAVSPRTKLIFVANPNNPTGTYVSREQLIAFLAAVPPQVIVVLDEAYFEYVVADDYPNGLEFLAEYPNLVVTRTFSKIHGLAALRIGYGIASEEITDLLNRVRQPFNTSMVAQNAALASLEDGQHVVRSRDLNVRQLARLAEVCSELGLGTIPSVANFLAVEFGDRSDEIYQALLHQGIIVRPVANYQMANYLRVTIGRAQEMDRLIAALRKLVATEL